MRKWTIYKIVNPLGQVYIGRTSDFSKRKSAYRRLAVCVKGVKVLYESLQAHGFDKHNISIIDEIYGGKDEADSKEMFWIRTMMCNRNKWPEMMGMNQTDGGSVIRLVGRKMPLEAILRSANAKRGKCRSEETKRKISISKKGRKNSEESKIKNSVAHLGRKCSEEAKKRMSDNSGTNKKVIVYNESIELCFKNMTDAAKYIGVSIGTVSLIANEKQKETHGYKIKFKKDAN